MRYSHQAYSRFRGAKKAGAKKLNVLKRTFDGIVFDSIAEGLYYELLKFEKKEFEVKPVVKCVVNGVMVTSYEFDFKVKYGDVWRYVEYKGYWEKHSKIRFKLVLAVLGDPVVVVTEKSEHLVRANKNGRLYCFENDDWRPYKWGE